MIQALHPRFTMPAKGLQRPEATPNGNGKAKPEQAPTGNGQAGPPGNGQATPEVMPAASACHDAKGRFTKGNKAGIGHPFARQLAQTRQLVLECTTPDKLRAVTNAMLEKAQSGDVAAARVIFEYAIGKPKSVVEPDDLDKDEMQHFKDASIMIFQAAKMLVGVEPRLPLTMLRTVWPAFTDKFGKDLGAKLMEGLPVHDKSVKPPSEQAAPQAASSGTSINEQVKDLIDAINRCPSAAAAVCRAVSAAAGLGETAGEPAASPSGAESNGRQGAGPAQKAPSATVANGKPAAPLSGGSPSPTVSNSQTTGKSARATGGLPAGGG